MYDRTYLLAAIALGGATLCAPSAEAKIEKVVLSGVATDLSSPAVRGTSFTATFAYDTDAPIIFDDGSSKTYVGISGKPGELAQPFAIESSLGSESFSVGEISLDYIGAGDYLFTLEGDLPDGARKAQLEIGLPLDTTFDDQKLPLEFGNHLIAHLYLQPIAPGGDFIIGDVSRITSISAAPEPGGWVLMVGAIGLAGGVLRRRRGFKATARLA